MFNEQEEYPQENKAKEKEQSLFREEAISSHNDTAVGKRIEIKSIGINVTLCISLLSTILIILFVIFGRYTNRAQLTGAVIPSSGIVKIYAPRAGYITNTNIKEGNQVVKGESLLNIVSDEKSAIGETQLTVLSHLRQQHSELIAESIRRQELGKFEKSGLQQQREILIQEKQYLKEQITKATEHLHSLTTIVDKYKKLAENKLIGNAELFERIEIQMRYYDDLERLRRESIQTDLKLFENQNMLDSMSLKLASEISNITRQLNEIDREIARSESLRQSEISAPTQGTVTTILVHSGQYVPAGTLLLSILPSSSEVEIHLFAQSDSIGFIRENAKVMLRYPAFPYQKFGLHPAHVKEISRVTISQEDATNSINSIPIKASSTPNEGLYRVVVTPENNYIMAYGETEKLKPGMSVEADVFLDTRYIYEWLFEPLFSIRGF